MARAGHFGSLLNSLLRLLRPIRREERALAKKTSTTAKVRMRMDELEHARFQITEAMVSLSDAEEAYGRASPITRDELKQAKLKAYRATRDLQSADDAMREMTTVLHLVKHLNRSLTG